MVKEGKERLLLIVEDAQWMDSNSMKILLKAKLRRFRLTVRSHPSTLAMLDLFNTKTNIKIET